MSAVLVTTPWAEFDDLVARAGIREAEWTPLTVDGAPQALTRLRALLRERGVVVDGPQPAAQPPDEPANDDDSEVSRSLAYGGIYGLIGRISRLGLSPQQLAVYVYFIGCRNKATGQAWQGMRRVAEHTAMSLSTVQAARDTLIAAGLLVPAGKRTEGRRADRASNCFYICLPTIATEDERRAKVKKAQKAARPHRKTVPPTAWTVPPTVTTVPPTERTVPPTQCTVPPRVLEVRESEATARRMTLE